MNKTIKMLLPLVAVCALVAGCLGNGKTIAVPEATQKAPLFPAPFVNVHLGMTERDFRAI